MIIPPDETFIHMYYICTSRYLFLEIVRDHNPRRLRLHAEDALEDLPLQPAEVHDGLRKVRDGSHCLFRSSEHTMYVVYRVAC